ncbi:S8 family serine peptidase [Streptomyces sp. 4N509B]|uniref:S8 family serine peptidase n=1 Tax=Streptomyces sp. 4N509B TaxID=3457413 RepID=UPI003FD03B2D
MRRAVVAAAAALTVAAGGMTFLPAAGAADGADGGGGAFGAGPVDREVTLITGDRVLLDASGEVVGLRRAEGRERVPVAVRESEDGGRLVVPQDAAPLIRQGLLDERLFDVTTLSGAPYRRLADGGLPVIVQYRGDRPAAEATARAEVREAAPAGERSWLESVNGEAVTLRPAQAADTWQALTRPVDASASGGGEGVGAATLALERGVAAVALDGLREASLDVSVPRIGAPTAWEAGFDGTGATIAVLDTGIDTTHADLAGGQVVAERDFTWTGHTGDVNGHGTHVASTAAGSGAMSDGLYSGVAPGADLINAKVLDDYGWGLDSDIILGMEWAVEQGADVVNMSLGGPDRPELDPLEEAVNVLSAESGALFVIAAGNDGPTGGTVGSPASADAALTVGAVDDADQPADFSARGPRVGDGALKPDLVAPGVDIGAAVVPGSEVEREGEPVAEGYAAISGTSMASPHVAGAAALLAQQHPDWTGERIKAALMASASGLTVGAAAGSEGVQHPALTQGAGLVDVARAVEQTVVAEPSSLSFGTAAYPHGDDEPVARELTYRNLGSSDVTLDLSLRAQGPDGAPAPEGMFTPSAHQVAVPAGGTAAVTVTADPRLGGDVTGAYSVFVTATAGGEGDAGAQTVRTAGVVDRESERYDLTIEATDLDGSPYADWGVSIERMDGPLGSVPVSQEEGSVTFRVPPGEYFAVMDGVRLDADGMVTGGERFVQPLLQVSGDTVVPFDTRQGEEIDLGLFEESAAQTDVILGHDRRGAMNEFLIVPPGLPDGFRTHHLGPEMSGEEFSALVATGWQAEGARYHTSHTSEGRYFTGLTERLAEDEFAELAVVQGTSGADRLGTVVVFPENSPATGMRDFLSYDEPLPQATTEYVRAGAGEWVIGASQFSADLSVWESDYQSPARTYEAGQRYELTMNVGVFGPDLGENAGRGLHRTGDLLFSDLAPFTDGQGNALINGPAASFSISLLRDGEPFLTEADARHCAGFQLSPPDINLPNCFRFQLPPEEARYELVSTISRAGISEVSTEVTTALSFTSGHVPDGEEAALPASVVRFTPELAEDSTAPAGQRTRIPVTVEGAAAGENLASLTLRVSVDGGETWRRALVRRGAVTVVNPPAGGSVSLQAEVTDRDGNTTTQTIIDAYRTS